jgi:CubicO group peptidase (beta-lactamase class C family)
MSDETSIYYPLPESRGGWRSLAEASGVRAVAGMNLDRLSPARAWNAQFPVPSAVVIIRRGHLVAEWYENGARPDTTFNIYSCTKSFTGTAYGILFEDGRQGRLYSGPAVDLDSPAYPHIPAGYPLTDPRKERILFRHLLSMTSGIPGESIGIYGIPTAPGINPFEAALGRFPIKARDLPTELWTSNLAAEPGSRWDYSDPAFSHLSLAFRNIAGRELGEFMQERVFGPIGIESLTWDLLGIDDGHVGQHSNPCGSIHVSARELARFGYLMARQGAWAGQQLVAPWWLELCTRNSQALQPAYGLTWWANTHGLWPEVPRDAFAAMGFNTNLCCVIPSLDLIVVRIGVGPTQSTEIIAAPFLAAVVQAVVAGDSQ